MTVRSLITLLILIALIGTGLWFGKPYWVPYFSNSKDVITKDQTSALSEAEGNVLIHAFSLIKIAVTNHYYEQNKLPTDIATLDIEIPETLKARVLRDGVIEVLIDSRPDTRIYITPKTVSSSKLEWGCVSPDISGIASIIEDCRYDKTFQVTTTAEKPSTGEPSVATPSVNVQEKYATAESKKVVLIVTSCGDVLCMYPIGRMINGKLDFLFPKSKSACNHKTTQKDSIMCSTINSSHIPEFIASAIYPNTGYTYTLFNNLGQRVGVIHPLESAVKFKKGGYLSPNAKFLPDAGSNSYMLGERFNLATNIPVTPAKGWKIIAVDKQYKIQLLNKVKQYIKKTHGEKAYLTLGKPIYDVDANVFKVGNKHVEFVAVTFLSKKKPEENSYSISLVWGLRKDNKPTVIEQFGEGGTDPYPSPYSLIGAMDIGNDGTIELVFHWSNNRESRYAIWQGGPNSYKPIAVIEVF